MAEPLEHILDRMATERWVHRGLRTLLRAAWLSVCIWCVGLGAQLLWGWQLRAGVVGALALAALGGGLALLLRQRLRPPQAARRLDGRFHLDEQLATAIEVAATDPPPGSVAARLVDEATHTAALLQRRISRRQRPPWNDVLTLALLGLVALGLMLLGGGRLPDLPIAPLAIPPLAAPQDPAEQLPQEPPAEQPGQPAADQPGAGEGGDPQIIQELADALRDQGATRPAAEALDQGDLAGAARELRELADQAGQLSDDTREGLAERLRDAADALRERDPGLAEQLDQSADQIERGGDSAAQGLDDLARAIEQLPTGQGQPGEGEQPGQAGPGEQPGQGDQGGQQGQGDQPGQAGQGGEGDQPGGGSLGQGNGAGSGGSEGEQRADDDSGRLGVEGQPVPLDSAEPGDVPAEADGPLEPGAGPARPGFTEGDSADRQRVDVADDPLRVPMDERDVVQEYFQP